MPTYAQHVLEAIQSSDAPIMPDKLLRLVQQSRKQSGYTKCSERHLNNAIQKLLKGKIIRQEPDQSYCMSDRSPVTKPEPQTEPEPEPEPGAEVSGSSSAPAPDPSHTTAAQLPRKKRLSAYNLFTKQYMSEHKNDFKRDVLMQNISKEWKAIKADKKKHQYWKAKAKKAVQAPPSAPPQSSNTKARRTRRAKRSKPPAAKEQEPEEEEEAESLNFELDVADISAEFDQIQNKLPQINEKRHQAENDPDSKTIDAPAPPVAEAAIQTAHPPEEAVNRHPHTSNLPRKGSSSNLQLNKASSTNPGSRTQSEEDGGPGTSAEGKTTTALDNRSKEQHKTSHPKNTPEKAVEAKKGQEEKPITKDPPSVAANQHGSDGVQAEEEAPNAKEPEADVVDDVNPLEERLTTQAGEGPRGALETKVSDVNLFGDVIQPTERISDSLLNSLYWTSLMQNKYHVAPPLAESEK